ncbi:sensor domain-containing diguanylate cyclase [Roseospira marina]|uniref:sensor domain-containing diguanylate cyclase n=1 Tax=Roseospira marina TaxID=140057 RepID=UPI0014782AF1|nr:sensor domain-containing diguanylate cyclase [Roseospira marina]MBB4313363.1 diguanylate cyclase (GGDEF)-like protein/PAS domain S-box-containing protein [Roseospira marina]MBB5085896.1 diguanylate cyclase (GGDEF)-like protein/PAS domain S-box-containing protein [Roseospira marina]
MSSLLAYAGPAALFDGAGHVLAQNHHAHSLVELMAHPDAVSLRAALQSALDTAMPIMRSARGLDDSGVSSFDLTLLPSADHRVVLVLARDTSLDTSLRSALAESRARFKDFVDLSSDFAWETGLDGRLVFVSPGGALGRSARDLVGTNPLDLIDPGGRTDAGTLFATRQRRRDVELWARDNRGRRVRLLASATPILAADNTWLGTRGICRDITEQHVKDVALRRAQERDRVRSHVVRTFRDQVDVETMLTVAAGALAHGVGATTCQILRRSTESTAILPPQDPAGTPELVLGGRYGPDLGPPPPAALARAMHGGDETMRFQFWETRTETHAILAIGTSHRQAPNGAVVLWRPAERGAWTADDRLLILDVAGQVGIANEQIARYETVRDQSRTDPLTGLLNRRGFMLDVERRLRRLAHSERPAALLYIDLDNFKPVNDRYGHARGDQVLILMAEILSTRTRPTDLIARLGGDEFAVWLEDADAEGSRLKADNLLSGSALLRTLSADTAAPLSMSIGIAVTSGARPETVESLCDRADAAMYRAKQTGKSRHFLAAPPPDTPPDTPPGGPPDAPPTGGSASEPTHHGIAGSSEG